MRVSDNGFSDSRFFTGLGARFGMTSGGARI
jgi:hypothetical protein